MLSQAQPAQPAVDQKTTATKPAATAAGPKIEVKSTLENLRTAFNGESNAHATYLAFAKKADEEGFGPVASLFRAAARSEEIHARNHATVIKQLGGVPKAEIKPPLAKSTKENLEQAIAGETYESTTMYPAFVRQALKEKINNAHQTFNRARRVEIQHGRLYQEALNNLNAWKGAAQDFQVCPVCGYTVATLDFKSCPICRTDRDKFKVVR